MSLIHALPTLSASLLSEVLGDAKGRLLRNDRGLAPGPGGTRNATQHAVVLKLLAGRNGPMPSPDHHLPRLFRALAPSKRSP